MAVGLVVLALAGSSHSGFGVRAADRSAALEAPRTSKPEIVLDKEIRLQKKEKLAGLLSRLAGRKRELIFARPYGVAWSGDDLLVSDPGAGRVVRVQENGAAVFSRVGLFESPIGIAVCNGDVIVSDSELGLVAKLQPGMNSLVPVVEGLTRPTGLACHDARMAVVETAEHRVLVLDLDGPAEEAPPYKIIGARGEAEGSFNFPTAVAMTSDSLFIGDTLNSRVQVFDSASLEFKYSFGSLGDASGEMPRLKDIEIDDQGNLWLSDAFLDEVAVYTPRGRFLMSLGMPKGQEGPFSFPAGIAANEDGSIAVVDSFNRRVQILRVVLPSGEDG